MYKTINSFCDLNFLKTKDHVFCLDSGGLDSAYLICRLIKEFNVTVHTLTVDVGQVDSSPIKLPDDIRSLVIRHEVDAKKEFADEYVLPLLHANGVYLDQHPLSASLSRPLIAKHLVSLANENNIETILHSATPTQNSMRRFNTSIKDLSFNGAAGSPYMQDNISRADKAEYIKSLGGFVTAKRSFSIDTNLLCREFESGELDNPEEIRVDEDMFLWTKSCPQEKINIKVSINAGIPTHLNDELLTLTDIIEKLNLTVGSFEIGRYVGLEEGPAQLKVVEVRESPAATVLLKAFSDLINASFDYNTILKKRYLDQLWTCEAVEGRWFGSLKSAIDCFNKDFLKSLNGSVTFEVSHKTLNCVSIISESPTYISNREKHDSASSKVRAA